MAITKALSIIWLLLVMSISMHFAYGADGDATVEAGVTGQAIDGRKDDADLEEVVVTGQKEVDRSVIDPRTAQLFSVAGAADDPLQAIFALPGVTFSVDGEPVIRGSAPQDNAYYIDLIPAEYLFHVFGNSIFNKNLIQKFDLHPAAFPSQFSNATGGVIDVKLRTPRQQKFTTTVNLSFLLTGIMVESSITENQAFYVSYRRSLIDKFFDAQAADAEEDGFRIARFPVARDYQMKYNWYINDRAALSFVAAGANDTLAAELLANSDAALRDPDLEGPLGYDDGFDSQGIIWDWKSETGNQQFKTTVSHIRNDTELFFGASQRIDILADRYLARLDYSLAVFERHQLALGLSREWQSYKNDIRLKYVACSDFDPDCFPQNATFIDVKNTVKVNINSFFAQDVINLSSRQQLTFGLHYFADDYLGESRIEPRLRWQYDLTDKRRISAAAGQYSQLPELDEIIPGTGNPNLTKIKANHYVLGIEQDFGRGWSWKADAYYKQLSDIVISVSDPTADDFELGYSNDANGKAYGAEFVINKNPTGKWFGWLALSLSKTERTDLRSGATAPFSYDKPVMLDLVFNYDFTERWMMGVKWSYQTGGLYTPIVDLRPSGIPNILEPVYGSFNSQRYPDYHRLDLRLEFVDSRNWGHWSLYFDLINLYNRTNIQSYDYSPRDEDTLNNNPPGFGEDVPIAASPLIEFFPSIGFELRF